MKIMLKLLSANAAIGVFPLLFIPVLTHLYAPEFFGAFGIVAGASALVAGVMTLRLEFAIYQSSSPVVFFKLAAAIIRCIIVGGGVCFFVAAILFFILSGEYFSWVIFGVFAAMIYAAISFVNAVNVRKRNFDGLIHSKILMALLVPLSQMALANFFEQGLIYGYLLGLIGTFTVLVLKDRKIILRIFFLKVSFWGVVKGYRGFILYSTPSYLLNNISNYLVLISINYAYGVANAGLYQMASRIAAAPTMLVSSAAGDYMRGELSIGNLSVKAQSALKIKILICVSIVAALTAFVFSVSVGHIVGFLGSKWFNLSETLNILIVLIFFQMVGNPFSPVALMNGFQRDEAALQLMLLIMTIFLYSLVDSYSSYLRGYTIIMAAVYVYVVILAFKKKTSIE